MKTNFEFIQEPNHQIIEIKFFDTIIDLHNACSFNRLIFDLKKNEIVFEWRYYYTFKNDEWMEFKMLFKKVETFKVEPWLVDIPFEQNTVLDEVMLNGNSSLWLFNGGLKIEITSKEIEFIEGRETSFAASS